MYIYMYIYPSNIISFVPKNMIKLVNGFAKEMIKKIGVITQSFYRQKVERFNP